MPRHSQSNGRRRRARNASRNAQGHPSHIVQARISTGAHGRPNPHPTAGPSSAGPSSADPSGDSSSRTRAAEAPRPSWGAGTRLCNQAAFVRACLAQFEVIEGNEIECDVDDDVDTWPDFRHLETARKEDSALAALKDSLVGGTRTESSHLRQLISEANEVRLEPGAAAKTGRPPHLLPGQVEVPTLPPRKGGWKRIRLEPGKTVRVYARQSNGERKLALLATCRPPWLSKLVQTEHGGDWGELGDVLHKLAWIGDPLDRANVASDDNPGRVVLAGLTAHYCSTTVDYLGMKGFKVRPYKWNEKLEVLYPMAKLHRVAEAMSQDFKELMPEQYAINAGYVDDLPEDLRMVATSATTTYEIAEDMTTDIHADDDNLEGTSCLIGVFSTSTKKRQVEGGGQVMVRLGLAIDTPPGSLLISEYVEEHMNLPMYNSGGSVHREALITFINKDVPKYAKVGRDRKEFKERWEVEKARRLSPVSSRPRKIAGRRIMYNHWTAVDRVKEIKAGRVGKRKR